MIYSIPSKIDVRTVFLLMAERIYFLPYRNVLIIHFAVLYRPETVAVLEPDMEEVQSMVGPIDLVTYPIKCCCAPFCSGITQLHYNRKVQLSPGFQ